MYADKHEILAAGQTEAARMKSAIAEVAADANVTMNARQFATLATLVENLCEIADGTIAGGMGDPRYWVPLAEYARLKREKEELAARSDPFDLPAAGWNAAFNPAEILGLSASRPIM